MPWARCKNSRREGELAASHCPVRQRLGPWIVSYHAPPPTDHKWRMWRANVGRRRVGGALYNLKGFHPVNWKDIISWPGDALCEPVPYGVKTQREEGEKRKGEISVALTGNVTDKKILCWHGFETLSVVSACVKNNKWCTFDIMKNVQ